MVTITPIYAALTALIFLVLSSRVISYRISHRVLMGDRDDKALFARIRAQANCAEYAPIALFLLLMTELVGAPGYVVHLLGIALVAGRLFHAYGLSKHPQVLPLRQLGMVLNLIMIALSALGLLAHALL